MPGCFVLDSTCLYSQVGLYHQEMPLKEQNRAYL